MVQEDNVNFYDPEMDADLNQQDRFNHDELVRVLMFLGLCHTIVIDQKKGTYNAASPDELALVNAAKQFGFEFKGFDKDDKMVVFEKSKNILHKYELLNVCEFNSTRKRMSVIVRDKHGTITLMCKGADSVIEQRLSQKSLNSQTLEKT